MHQQSLNLSRRIIKLSKCIFRSQMLLKYVIPVPNYHIHYGILCGVLMWRPPPPHNNASPPPLLSPLSFFFFPYPFLVFCSSVFLPESSRVTATWVRTQGCWRGTRLTVANGARA